MERVTRQGIWRSQGNNGNNLLTAINNQINANPNSEVTKIDIVRAGNNDFHAFMIYNTIRGVKGVRMSKRIRAQGVFRVDGANNPTALEADINTWLSGFTNRVIVDISILRATGSSYHAFILWKDVF